MDLATQVQVASAIVHLQEAVFELKRGGVAAAQFDEAAADSALSIPSVKGWLDNLRENGLLPERRS